MRRIAGLALAALLAAPATAAHAAPPKRVAGVKLSWPSKTVFKPGDTVTLGVRSNGRRAQVALLSGKKVLARKTLRNGTFRAKLPGGNQVYKLRATVAGKRYSSELKTAACDGTTGTLNADGQTGATGAPLRLTVTNTGPTCMSVPSRLLISWIGADGQAVGLDVDGNVRLPNDGRIATPSPPVEVGPGKSHTINAHVPLRLPDGAYTIRWGSVSTTFTSDSCIGRATATTTVLELGATSVPAGGRLPYALVNTGPGCLRTGVAYRLERREADGSYTTVNANEPFIAIGLLLRSGERYPGTANIAADLPPGTYRLTHESSATFEVTAP